MEVRFSTLLGEPPLQSPSVPLELDSKDELPLSLSLALSQPERCQPENNPKRLSLDTLRAGAWFLLLNGEVSRLSVRPSWLGRLRRDGVPRNSSWSLGLERRGLV